MGWNVPRRNLSLLTVDTGTSGWKVLIEAGYRDAKAGCNLLDRDGRIAEQRQPGGRVLLVEHGRATAGAATSAGGGEPGEAPLLDDGPG